MQWRDTELNQTEKYKTVAEALTSLWDFRGETAFSGLESSVNLYISIHAVQERSKKSVDIVKLSRISDKMKLPLAVILAGRDIVMDDAYEYRVWRKAYPPNLPEEK
jgi:hypothetical protein